MVHSTDQAQAQALYWDTNGVTYGTDASGSFVWDSGTNWSTSINGNVATTGWVNGRNVIFAAGLPGAGTINISIAGTVQTNSITFSASNSSMTITGG